MNSERPAVRSELLPIVLLLYGAASLFHYAHNAEFLGDYPNLPVWLSPALIYGAWLGATTVGVAGYLLLRHGYPLVGLAALGVYGALGLDGLGHYGLAPYSGHTFTMNFSILLEAATAVVLLTAVAGLMLRHLRTGRLGK
jgi:hypothetical protein